MRQTVVAVGAVTLSSPGEGRLFVSGPDSAVLTEKVRQASDIVDVVSAFVSLRPAGRNMKGLCPFHKEKTPSFNVMPDRQFFKCFGCSAAGDVFKFIQLREGVDFLEAREILARRANISLEVRKSPKPVAVGEATRADLERVNQWAAKWFRQQYESDAGAACREYVRGRGLTDETVSAFELGFAPDAWDELKNAAIRKGIAESWLVSAGLLKQNENGRVYDAYRNRLIFPIYDSLSRVIGFGGRALGDDPAKYINSPQSALFDKSRCLYGIRESRESWKESRRAIITEGYLDCILCHQAGFSDAVATLGTALTADHARMLIRYVDKATLVFDSDEAGLAAADRAIPVILPEKLETNIAQVPEGKDPADLIVLQGKEGFERVLTSALPALEFKWRNTNRGYQCAGSDGDRRRSIESFLSFVGETINDRFVDAIQRGFILNQVGKLLGLTTDQVERQLRIVTRRQAPTDRLGDSAVRFGGLPRCSDAYQAAMREILAVLLNEPGYYSVVQEIYDPARCEDRLEREIGLAVVENFDAGRPLEINQLMTRLAEVEDATGRIAELLIFGESRGNYDATIDGAAQRIREIDERRRLSQSLSSLRNGSAPLREGENDDGPNHVDADESEELDSILQSARKTNHFVARRHLAAPRHAGANRRGVRPSGDAR